MSGTAGSQRGRGVTSHPERISRRLGRFPALVTFRSGQSNASDRPAHDRSHVVARHQPGGMSRRVQYRDRQGAVRVRCATSLARWTTGLGMASSRPIAYLLTLRTFGTWLHGDARGSHNRLHRSYGTPPLPGRPRLEAMERLQARAPPQLLDGRSRAIVGRVANDVCAQPQVVDHAQAGGSRSVASQYPALVEARQHRVPMDGPLSRPGRPLRSVRSGRRSRRDLTN